MPKGYSEYNQSGWKHRKDSLQKMSQVKISRGNSAGEKNGRFRDGLAAYNSIHHWIRRRIKKPDHCELCGKPEEFNNVGKSKLQLSSRDKQYTRNIADWWFLCASCHKNYDLANPIKHRYSESKNPTPELKEVTHA